MNPDQDIESLDSAAEETAESISVDDFIRQLEAREKDLHITAETSIIEIAGGFDDSNLPDFIKEEFPQTTAVKVKPVKPVIDPKLKQANANLVAENKTLKGEISKLKAEQQEMMTDSQRRGKDFANFKSRTERERRESFQNQVSNLAVQMLPVLDNLNRGIEFAIQHEYTRDEEFSQFFDGVFLVNQQLNEVLGEMGIEPIITIGELFDPHLHEAAATAETDEVPPNTICEEMLKGYRIGDRVIRHSIVRVAKPVPTNEKPDVEKMVDPDSEPEMPISTAENDVSPDNQPDSAAAESDNPPQ